MRARGAGNRT
uniref:Uncharacterized protein n=1 Tax=Arundo donax TaxID=35708 RepID=A0A0A8Y2K0_ARUDO